MLLDNLFATIGTLGTAAALVGILAVVFAPAICLVVCPRGVLRATQRGL
ncbi:hypothetical protein AKJ09_09911 [Labilithrix luteola]|uniref:Uncharacterized protein n=1 Tax=Labilithrix luteola TaxID=1391654 RepID=A0A0K1QC03_9BACT|nr:hypothetical protein [Labilithrix luteola]AKV03248.1 hypothetical protein AKJ09_09911 [Labilithrix luteola]